MDGGDQLERVPWTDWEDDCDALNDETFGDGGEEYNWESSQVLLEDLDKKLDETPANGADNGFEDGGAEELLGAGALETASDEKSKETDYYDYENDNALEESISRLVLDDMDDSDDEEEARKMKLSRLGAASNSNTYFTPPQVATRHWLMDKELPGGSSLLGSSVWSMHPTVTPNEVSAPAPRKKFIFGYVLPPKSPKQPVQPQPPALIGPKTAPKSHFPDPGNDPYGEQLTYFWWAFTHELKKKPKRNPEGEGEGEGS